MMQLPWQVHEKNLPCACNHWREYICLVGWWNNFHSDLHFEKKENEGKNKTFDRRNEGVGNNWEIFNVLTYYLIMLKHCL